MSRSLASLTSGTLVVLTEDVERYPHFIAPAGAMGIVVDIGDPNIFAVTLDEHLPGAEDWDNEVHWILDTGDDPSRSLRPIDPKGTPAEWAEAFGLKQPVVSPVRLLVGNAGWGAVDAAGVWHADAYDTADEARAVVRALEPDVRFEDDDVSVHLPILCVAVIAAICAIADVLVVGGTIGYVFALVHIVMAAACASACVEEA